MLHRYRVVRVGDPIDLTGPLFISEEQINIGDVIWTDVWTPENYTWKVVRKDLSFEITKHVRTTLVVQKESDWWESQSQNLQQKS